MGVETILDRLLDETAQPADATETV